MCLNPRLVWDRQTSSPYSVPHLRITITHQQEIYSCPKQSPHSIHLDSETTPLLLLRLLSWSYETVRLGSRGAVQLPSSRVSRASLRLCRFYSSRDPTRSIYMLRRLCVPRKLPRDPTASCHVPGIVGSG